MNVLVFIGGTLVLFYAITRYSMPMRHWAYITAAALAVFTLMGGFSPAWGIAVWSLFLLPSILLGSHQLRRQWLSAPLLRRIRKVLPPMSSTERDAIESGTVGWEAELFRGNPDWGRLLTMQKPRLTEDEQAFVDGPVEQLCARIDDWDITHNLQDLPPDMWQFLKDNKFFGLIIPKKYGGLEFSAAAHSEAVMKISARSISVGVTVMVPNSLGPAELLLHYGTEQQKDYYLPRLADGREIPAFALTGPDAGSDAGAIPDSGVVCEGEFEGKKLKAADRGELEEGEAKDEAEEDAGEWWQATTRAVRACLAGAPEAEVVAVGLTGQKHALLALDAQDRPLGPAVLWADGRATAEAEYTEAPRPAATATAAMPNTSPCPRPMPARSRRCSPMPRLRRCCVRVLLATGRCASPGWSAGSGSGSTGSAPPRT